MTEKEKEQFKILEDQIIALQARIKEDRQISVRQLKLREKRIERLAAQNKELSKGYKQIWKELELKTKIVERVKAECPKEAYAMVSSHLERLEIHLARAEADLAHEKKHAQEAELLAFKVVGAYGQIPRLVRRIFVKALVQRTFVENDPPEMEEKDKEKT